MNTPISTPILFARLPILRPLDGNLTNSSQHASIGFRSMTESMPRANLLRWFLVWWILLVAIPYALAITPLGGIIASAGRWGYVSLFAIGRYLSFPAAVLKAPFFRPGDWGSWLPANAVGWTILALSHSALAFGVAWISAQIQKACVRGENE